MKKTIVFAVFILISASAFTQEKKASGKPIPHPVTMPQAPQPRQFVILLDENELQSLYDFIKNADIYSDKGRLQYLAVLDKHIRLLPPATTDSVKSKK